MCSCECASGVLSLIRGPIDHDEKRKDFENLVAFLTKVPLLRNNLPRAMIPKMAQSLTRKKWRAGVSLVQQGDTGKALYLIQSGVALVYVCGEGSNIAELRCELRAGDYFGGHTLITSRPNIATITAGYDEEEGELVTLSMSRNKFEESGLKNWLHFPKRPALYEAGRDVQNDPKKGSRKTPAEAELIRTALLENANLRAFVKLEEEQLNGLVQAAEMREYAEGTIVGKRGQAAEELTIIARGEIEVLISDEVVGTKSGYMSLEAKIEQRGMAERMLRKQAFLQSLLKTATPKCRASVMAVPERANSESTSAGAFESLSARQHSGISVTGQLGTPQSGPAAIPAQFNAQSDPQIGERRVSDPFGLDGSSGSTSRGPRQGYQSRSKDCVPASPPQMVRGISATEVLSRTLSQVGATPGSPSGRWSRRSTTVTDLAEQVPPPQSGVWSRGHTTPDPGQAPPPSKRPKQPRQGKSASQSAGIQGVARHSSTVSFDETMAQPFHRVPSLEEVTGQDAALGPGDSFGELAVLYHVRREATFRARSRCQAFAISRADFFRLCQQAGCTKKVKEYLKVIDEVHALQSLLSAEKYQLACHVHSVVDFKTGERIIHQGKDRLANQWYIVCQGGAEQYMMKPGADGQERVHLVSLRRGSHFGERSLLRGDTSSQSNVDTNEGGMTCLVFEFTAVEDILRKVFMCPGSDLPRPDCPIEEWCQRLQTGWNASQSIGTIASNKRGQTVQFEDLEKKCKLGRGGFCAVNLVEDVTDRKKYALKTMSKGYLEQCGAERQIRWERELLSIVDSPFIINLHKTFQDSQHIYFLLEAALGGSLSDVMNNHPEVFQQDQPRGSAAAFYVGCIALALQHLHERRIVHRDVKTENALLDERGYAKLCDMGFARYVLGKTSTLAGTPDYMAPEMIDFPHTHDLSVDWWALGVLTFELLAGQTPFEDEGLAEPRGRLLAIRRSQESGKLLFPFSFPYASRTFVNALLRKLPHRLGAGEGGAEKVKEHPMFRAVKLNWQEFEARQMAAPFSQAWDESAIDIGQGDPGQYNVDLYGCPIDTGEDLLLSPQKSGLGLDLHDSLYVPFLEKSGGEDEWSRLVST